MGLGRCLSVGGRWRCRRRIQRLGAGHERRTDPGKTDRRRRTGAPLPRDAATVLSRLPLFDVRRDRADPQPAWRAAFIRDRGSVRRRAPTTCAERFGSTRSGPHSRRPRDATCCGLLRTRMAQQLGNARAFPTGSRSNCWAVSCGLETLINCAERPSSDDSEGRLYVKSPGIFPFDMATHTRKAVGDKELETGWSLDHHARTIDSANVEFREHETGWLTVRARQQAPVMPDWAGLMCQALSMATAHTIRPVVAVREFSTRKDVGLFSGPFSHPRSYLTRPVPPAEKQDFWGLVQHFFEWARAVDQTVASGVFEELEGIRNGSMGSIRTAALTLAVAVESLAGLLLKSDKVVAKGRDQSVDLLLEHVGAWEGEPSTRHRALSMLGSLKSVRAVDRLHGFARSHGIPSALVDGWKKLRDVAAHGRPRTRLRSCTTGTSRQSSSRTECLRSRWATKARSAQLHHMVGGSMNGGCRWTHHQRPNERLLRVLFLALLVVGLQAAQNALAVEEVDVPRLAAAAEMDAMHRRIRPARPLRIVGVVPRARGTSTFLPHRRVGLQRKRGRKTATPLYFCLVAGTGFEPATSGL